VIKINLLVRFSAPKLSRELATISIALQKILARFMKSPVDREFIAFLERDLSIAPEAIALVLRQKPASAQLPIMLWQYGLISLQQLDKIFDWREQQMA
jgi:Protein of unknown function (DUF2949)